MNAKTPPAACQLSQRYGIVKVFCALSVNGKNDFTAHYSSLRRKGHLGETLCLIKLLGSKILWDFRLG